MIINKQRRNSIRNAINLLERSADLIDDVRMDEQYALDNIPENLQNSEQYDAMEEAVDVLESAVSDIKDLKEDLERIIA